MGRAGEREGSRKGSGLGPALACALVFTACTGSLGGGAGTITGSGASTGAAAVGVNCGTVVVPAQSDQDAAAGTCTFALPAPPNADLSSAFIDVFVGGFRVPQDQAHTNGWDYADEGETAIQIFGPICDEILVGTSPAPTIAFRCVLN
jgi:hypothetical protein